MLDSLDNQVEGIKESVEADNERLDQIEHFFIHEVNYEKLFED